MQPKRVRGALLLALAVLGGALAAEAGHARQLLHKPRHAAVGGSESLPSTGSHQSRQGRHLLGGAPAAAAAAAAAAATAAAAAAGSGHPLPQGPGVSDDAPGRHLLQTPSAADCDRSVPNCETCRYQFYRGTVTKAVCMRCATGYVVKASGRGCWCAPGYYRDDAGVCQPCGVGFYCPGARATETSGALRIPCGANKVTTTTYARSDRECVVLPGFGWGAADESLPCPVGFYNSGYNTRKCTKCAGSLTTLGEGSTAPQQCVAPAGYYYLRGKALACAKGYYKAEVGNTECTRCPFGWTTAQDAPARTAPADCQYVEPGYYAPAGMLSSLGAADALPCPQDTYRNGDAAYGAPQNSAGLNCTACPAGMRTQSDGNTIQSQCLAPPGYGFAAGSGDAALCARGSYNPGWNREPCVPCGLGNFTTDAEGSVTSDDCKIPAGYGSATAPDGRTLAAAPCDAGTYGRDSDTYGLVEVECTKCMQFTTTAGVGSTTGAQCLTLGGYGWYNGAIQQCDYAYYSTGNHQDPCSYCGEGYNTTSGAGGTAPARGANSSDSCVIAAGWTADGHGGVKPCMQGFYKSLLGASACARCPAGTTTTLTFAPAQLSDCDACRPGFGSSGVDLGNPSCTICGSGTYSFGYVSGGAECAPCPKPDGYTGAMVSRRGIDNPDQCYPEFMTDAAFNSLLRYNYIPMDASSLTVTWNTTADGCEALCHAGGGCQYFVFTDYSAAGSKCSLRDVGVTPADVGGGGDYILFQISAGTYVTYTAHATDWDSAGVLLGSFPSLDAATTSCNRQAACVAIKSRAGAWRTVGGALLKDTTAKVRVSGPAINPWIPEPAAS